MPWGAVTVIRMYRASFRNPKGGEEGPVLGGLAASVIASVISDCNTYYVADTGRKQHYSTISGLIQLVISLECFIEITPDFLCP